MVGVWHGPRCQEIPLYASTCLTDASQIHPSEHSNRLPTSHLTPPIVEQHTSKQNSAMTETTPRITCQYLEQFSHRTVRILGKVDQLRGEQATVDAAGKITVHLNRVGSHPLTS